MNLPYVIFAALMLLTSFSVFPKKTEKNESTPFLEVRVDRNHTVEGERLIYEVVLFSPDQEVAGIDLIKNPVFSGLNFSRSAPDSHLDEVKKGGKIYYSAVIDRFFVGTDKKGKFQIGGGDYKVGINRMITVNDPFWGPSVATRIEMFALSAPDLAVVVEALPEKNRPADFSGAIGSFEVELELKRDVIAGEDSEVTVTISGKGDLSEISLPEIAKSFGNGLHFKSMTDERRYFIQQGSLGSEIEIECIFTAEKEGKYKIDPIAFSYYDSDKGKYMTVKSSPLEIVVGEAAEKSVPPPETIDI